MPFAVSVDLAFEGNAASIPLVRAFGRSTLAAWNLGGLTEAAVLVLSELATNAVLHARSAYTVLLALDGAGSLRIEVIDASPTLPLPRTANPGATTGRGLSIVQGLVTAWGSEPHGTGKCVWVLLDTDPTRRGSSWSYRGVAGRADGQGARGARGDGRASAPVGPEAMAA